MTDLLAARAQMALSLGFHIVFASIGVAMPFLMAAAHWKWLRTGDPLYRTLTKAWSKGVAIFFAVGAVSGTALSFELGLLWPGFMVHAGPIIGMPFSWEGTAFFLEAIALGVFLYGWDRVPRWAHWASGVAVGLSGVASAMFVICANAWMNAPTGFDWNDGNPTNIDPWAAMFNDAWLIQGVHMVVAAFEAVGFAVAGLHALLWLRTRLPVHLAALRIALVVGALAALVQPLVGDVAAKSVAVRQPAKLAAMEALFETTSAAPLLVGGVPDVEARTVRWGLEIPYALSVLAHGDPHAEVIGLDHIPRDEWPPVLIVHAAFQIMVGVGTGLAGVGLAGLLAVWRRPSLFEDPRFLRLLVVCTPLGFIALEAGWVVTEVGRQPWILYGLMRTAEALTPRPGILVTFSVYAVLYGFLAVVVSLLLARQIASLHLAVGAPPPGEAVMLSMVLFFLAVALVFYVVFAGADFGAGILEVFLGRDRRDEQRTLIARAMAPVWEANHVWLILAVVILFVAFPTVYTTVSTFLYIPLVALLVGIVARGTAFTFRHYDTLTTEFRGAYSGVFAASSLGSSLILGVLAGAIALGRIDPDASDTYTLYVAPWLNPFCLAVGVFTCALFALLAAVFLVGEATEATLRALFQRRARAAALVLVGAGAAVFGAAELDGLPLFRTFFTNRTSVFAFVLATALLVPFWRALSASGGRTRTRMLGTTIVTLVLLGWFAVQYPVALRLAHGAITFREAVAPEATLRALLGALVVGSALIFPALGYLLWVFKRDTFERTRTGF